MGGTPQQLPKEYEASAVMPHVASTWPASRGRSSLMLVHGLVDEEPHAPRHAAARPPVAGAAACGSRRRGRRPSSASRACWRRSREDARGARDEPGVSGRPSRGHAHGRRSGCHKTEAAKLRVQFQELKERHDGDLEKKKAQKGTRRISLAVGKRALKPGAAAAHLALRRTPLPGARAEGGSDCSDPVTMPVTLIPVPDA